MRNYPRQSVAFPANACELPMRSRRPWARVWPAILAFLAAGAIAQDDLPSAVAQPLAAAGIPAASVALHVQALDAAQPRLAHNAETAFNPASVMKLLTTYAALESLGPAYTWRTTALARGEVAGGTLAGDLHLKGSGDPQFVLEQLWLLLRQLRAKGVSRIGGDVVVDRSRFAPAPHDPGAFDGEPLAPYNTGADALLLNYNTLRISLLTDGKRVAALPELLPQGLDLLNFLQPAAGACGDWKDAVLPRLTFGGKRLALFGAYPADCGERVFNVALPDQRRYFEGVFRTLWRELGGRFDGKLRDGPVPAEARPLAQVESPPLAEIIREINKFSNNVMARQLLLTLAAERVGEPATESGGGAAIRAWLAQKGQDFPELVIENGSGLSRSERISAAHLGQLLQMAWRGPLMPEFIASLPVAGVDGTMKRRLAGRPASGHAHLKSGSLAGVRTLAGYVLDQSGRHWALVLLVNDPRAAAARDAQDALVDWLYRGAPD